MDPQFSSLFGQIQTKTVHRALSPIANRVSQLVLFHEAHEVSFIQGDSEKIKCGNELVSVDLPRFTRDINAALKGLTTAALDGRDIGAVALEEASISLMSSPKRASNTMPSACRDLLAAGESLAAAAASVSLSSEITIVASSSTSHARVERGRLVEAAKHVLRQTLRVLLIADRQEVERLMVIVEKSSELFVQLIESRSLKELVPRFKYFTDHLLEVADVVELRSRELTSAKRTEALAAALITLQKTPHTLCGSMQTYIK